MRNDVIDSEFITVLERAESDNGIVAPLGTLAERLTRLIEAIDDNEPERHKAKKAKLKERIAQLEEEGGKLARENWTLRKRIAANQGPIAGDTLQAMHALMERWFVKNTNAAKRIVVDVREYRHDTAGGDAMTNDNARNADHGATLADLTAKLDGIRERATCAAYYEQCDPAVASEQASRDIDDLLALVEHLIAANGRLLNDHEPRLRQIEQRIDALTPNAAPAQTPLTAERADYLSESEAAVKASGLDNTRLLMLERIHLAERAGNPFKSGEIGRHHWNQVRALFDQGLVTQDPYRITEAGRDVLLRAEAAIDDALVAANDGGAIVTKQFKKAQGE